MRSRLLVPVLILVALVTGCASLATPIGYEPPEVRRARIWKRVAVDVATLGLGEVFFIGRGKQLEVQQEWDAYAQSLRFQVQTGQITQGDAQLLWQNAVYQAQNVQMQQRAGLGLCVWHRGVLICL